MRKASAALREAGVPFLLGGGLACWARGGPPTDHDVDFLVRPEHAEAGLEALAGAGLETERPPEHWLVKGHHDGGLVGLIFEPSGPPPDDSMVYRGAGPEGDAGRM